MEGYFHVPPRRQGAKEHGLTFLSHEGWKAGRLRLLPPRREDAKERGLTFLATKTRRQEGCVLLPPRREDAKERGLTFVATKAGRQEDHQCSVAQLSAINYQLSAIGVTCSPVH